MTEPLPTTAGPAWPISFEPLPDFFHRRQADRLDRLAAGVELVTRRSESLRGNFVYPGLDITADIHVLGVPVGDVHYSLSPLNDRLYVSEFNIEREHQQRGTGTAALWRLARQYAMPLASMSEFGTSRGFWGKVERRFAAAGVELQRDIRSSEQAAIQERWAHLVPEPEHLRKIREYWEWVAAEKAAGRPAGPGIR